MREKGAVGRHGTGDRNRNRAGAGGGGQGRRREGCPFIPVFSLRRRLSWIVPRGLIWVFLLFLCFGALLFFAAGRGGGVVS